MAALLTLFIIILFLATSPANPGAVDQGLAAILGVTFAVPLGIITIVVGACRGNVGIGLLGFFGCLLSGAILGFPGTFLVCGILVWLAARTYQSNPPPGIPARVPEFLEESPQSELVRLKQRIAELEANKGEDGQ